jgi:hypothetical protein
VGVTSVKSLWVETVVLADSLPAMAKLLALAKEPGNHPRECTSGTAASYGRRARPFLAAWRVFLSNRTEVDFQEWRDGTAEKYRRFDRGELMPYDWRARARTDRSFYDRSPG